MRVGSAVETAQLRLGGQLQDAGLRLVKSGTASSGIEYRPLELLVRPVRPGSRACSGFRGDCSRAFFAGHVNCLPRISKRLSHSLVTARA